MDNIIDEVADLRDLDLPFDLDQVIPQCHECVRSQIKKYGKHVIDNNAVGRRFLVPCRGIKKELVSPMERATKTDDQLEIIEAVRDKVAFAAKFARLPGDVPWIARWYQEQVLRCTSRRKVLRIGRRTGKTDSVCIEILFKLFTSKNRKIFITGPQKVHVEEIFTRLRSFIASNPILRDSVSRDVAAPYYAIEMKNGSRVRGFAGGAKGKKEGLAGRGQDADDIYCEEMDYIDETALRGGIFPILHTTPETSLVGFSTPTGFKTPYRSLCEDNPHYKEFHFTYKVLPWWRQVETEKATFTEEEWTHEYLAEWGTAESGVYKPSYIDRALIDYKYSDMTRNPVWKYTIGTDWNEKYGTEIAVLGYNPFTNMFQVVETVHIERSEFTQLAGVTKLLELNKKWRPHFIYIDAGNGSTNYELLKKTAYDNMKRDGDIDTANLLRTLKKYDAGASIEIRDPVSSQKKKVPAKPFMVNASVRLFEQNKIRLSVHDNRLEKQLRSYIIERITPTKTPVYGLEDEKVKDHRLDAVNLSIVAFQLEFSSLHAQNVITDVAAVPDPRNIRKHATERGEEADRVSVPQERRLDGGFKKTPIEEQVFAQVPGRVDTRLNGIRTNRPGWSTDEEDLHVEKFLHRRRGRQSIRRGRPTRTNI
jgi:replicative DNA helicase